MKIKFIIITSIFIIFLYGCDKSDSNNYSSPKGACLYGPTNTEACLNNTTEEYCVDQCKGSWHSGQTCP